MGIHTFDSEEPKEREREKQIITPAIPHDQEVIPLKHNYSVGLDDYAILDIKRIRTSLIFDSTSIFHQECRGLIDLQKYIFERLLESLSQGAALREAQAYLPHIQ